MRNFYPKSRSAGKCRQCSKAIEKGQPAWWSQSQGWMCLECQGNDQPQAPKQPAATSAGNSDLPNIPGVTAPKVARTGKRVTIEFERFTDAAQAGAAKGKGRADNIELLDQYIDCSGQAYFNHHTVPEMLKMLETGCPKATSLVDQMREEIANEISLPTTNRRQLRRGRDFGDEIQADRYLDRIPEMWERMESERVPAKVVTIAINLAVSSTETQKHLAYRAAAGIALADALTERGASVEIRLFKCTGNNPTNKVDEYVTTITAKHSDQPMSIPDLAVSCCDIGIARLGMIFGSMRYLRGTVRQGLGAPKTIPNDLKIADFIADRQVNSREKAVEWVRQAVNKFQTGEQA